MRAPPFFKAEDSFNDNLCFSVLTLLVGPSKDLDLRSDAGAYRTTRKQTFFL